MLRSWYDITVDWRVMLKTNDKTSRNRRCISKKLCI